METYTINVDTNVDTSGTAALTSGARAASAFERAMDRARQAIERFNAVQRTAQRMQPPAARTSGSGIFGGGSGTSGRGTAGLGGFNVVIGVRDLASRAITSVGSALRNLVRTPFNVVMRITQSVASGAGSLISGAAKGVGSLLNPVGLLATGAAAVGAVAASSAWPLKLAANMETAQIAFEVFLGDAGKAAVLMRQLQDFANATPFAFPELRDAGQRLLAFGFSADHLIPMLKVIGDAVSGIGGSMADQGQRMVLALGQIRARGRVMGQEMMQLQELGVPALEILTAGWAKLHPEMIQTTEDMQNAITAGIVPANTSIGILLEGIEKRFPNMMERQQQTLAGLWNTITDTFSNGPILAWGQGLADAVVPRLKEMNSWLGNNGETLNAFNARVRKFGAFFAEGIVNTAEHAVKWFGQLMPQLMQAPDAIAAFGIIGRKAFQDITARMGPFGKFLQDAVTTYIPNLVKWGQMAWATFQSWLPTFAQIQSRIGNVFGVIQKLLSGDMSGVGGIAAQAGQGVLAMLAPWLPVIQTWISGTFAPWVQNVAMPWVLAAMSQLGNGLWQWIQDAAPIAVQRLQEWAAVVMPMLWQWIVDATPGALGALGAYLSELGAWAINSFPAWRDQMNTWTIGAIGWIIDAATAAVPVLGTFLGGLLTWVADNAPGLTEKFLSEWVPAAIGWLAVAAVQILPKLAQFLGAILQWIATDAIPQLARFGVLMGAAIVRGMIGGIASLYNQIPAPIRAAMENSMPALRGIQALGQMATQGANSLTAAAGPGGQNDTGLRSADAAAVERARGMLGATTMLVNGATESVANQCERFVETLYGTAGAFGNARVAGDRLIDASTAGTKLADAPAGASVFFSNYGDTGGAGHVGIATGRGTFISALANGVTETGPGSKDWDYWNKYYRGYGRASYGTGANGGGGLLQGMPGAAPGTPTGAPGGTSLGGMTLAPNSAQYTGAFEAAAGKYNLDPKLLYFQALQESNFNPDVISGAKRSSAGARGIAQFMPATGAGVARQLGVSEDQFWSDPNLQIMGQARMMRDLLNQFGGDTSQALAAYNWGPGNVQKNGMSNLPAETSRYVGTITGNLANAGASVQINTINVNGAGSTEQIAREIVDAMAAELAAGLTASGENRVTP